MCDDKSLVAEARAFVDEVWEELVADIDTLVQVESVEDLEQAAPGMPFGPAPREALDRALRIAARLGLDARDDHGYVGLADLPGAREDAYVATIAHSDIVPLGTGWTYDPLHVSRIDGFLVGRGVLDDKGPLVLSLYAAHFFVRRVERCATRLPYTLRCIIGCNEETGMADVEYYLKNYPEPAFCFTPDAVFPLICGEKGRFYAEVTSAELDALAGRIVSLVGGTVANAVPDTAEAVIRASLGDLAACADIDFEPAGTDEQGRELCKLIARGKGGHASMPEHARNAIGILVDYLTEQGICTEQERTWLEFERLLLADSAGTGIGIAVADDAFGPLTCVGGTVRTFVDGKTMRFAQTMDVRYPTCTTGEALLSRVGEVAGAHGAKVTDSDDSVPFYIAPESDEIRTLVRTYQEITGNTDGPFTIGGGTYARHFRRAVAFGPDDQHALAPAWVGQEHGPNEGVAEETLKRALVIYIVSIARLMQLDLG